QKFLEKFVGDFDVVKTISVQTGKSVESKGECKQTMTHEGRFLLSEFTFQQAAVKSTGTGMIGFEPETGLFTSVWVDSRQTKMSLRKSKARFNGEEIVLFRKSLKEGDKERLSRTVTRLEEGGRRITHRQYNIAADGSERLFMELVLTRKAK